MIEAQDHTDNAVQREKQRERVTSSSAWDRPRRTPSVDEDEIPLTRLVTKLFIPISSLLGARFKGTRLRCYHRAIGSLSV